MDDQPRKTLLITGGSGLLAVNWAAAMRANMSIVLGWHTRPVSMMGVVCQQIDLTSVDALLRLFTSLSPQAVVHTAALTNVEACEHNPSLARFVNVGLAENVARACSSFGIPLVHISTDHLFSDVGSDIDEDTPVSPVNVYGRTKSDAERVVLDVASHAIVVRTNFYGWGPHYRRSFSDTIIDSLRAGRRVALFDDVRYSPILIDTLASAVHQLLDEECSGVFNVSPDESLTKYQFGMETAIEFRLDSDLIVPIHLRDLGSLTNRPHNMALSNGKLRKQLRRSVGTIVDDLKILGTQEAIGRAREILLCG